MVGCLLLLIHFGGIRWRLGRWPDPGPEWLCTFFFQAALMMALVRGLARMLGGQYDLGHGRSTTDSPVERGLVRLLGGRPLMPFFGFALIFFLILACRPYRTGFLEWWLRGFWLLAAFQGVGLGLLVVIWLVARSRGAATNTATWVSFVQVLSMTPFFWPAYGFQLGELVAGEVQPAAFTVPLHGAMIGWAVGSILGALNPVGLGKTEVPAPETGQDRDRNQPGSPE